MMEEVYYKCKYCGEEVSSKSLADTMTLIGTCFQHKNKKHEFEELYK